MAQEKKLFFDTPLGRLEVICVNDELCSLSICEGEDEYQYTPGHTLNKTHVTNIITQQLKEYFSHSNSFHEIPLAPNGTEFQKSVWHELIKIPVGETRTYGEIARHLKSSPRAVGNACRKNPIAIIIPCHRVVSANGLGGYAGQTQGQQLDIKRWLLKHEGVSV